MCDRVGEWLKRNGVEHTPGLLLDPETYEVTEEAQPYYDLAKQRNISSAPLVVTLDDHGNVVDIFGGYNPAKLKELKHV